MRLQETKKYQFSEKNNNNKKIKKEAMEDCFVLGRTLKPKCVVVVVKIVCVYVGALRSSREGQWRPGQIKRRRKNKNHPVC